MVVQALVDGVGDFPSVADDRDVFALGAGGDVGGGGVGGHRDRVTGVQAVVVAVPADRFAQPVAARGPQRQGGIAFVGVAHPPHLTQALRPRQVLAEVLEHAAAGFDRRELIGVADQDHLGVRGRAAHDSSRLSSGVPTMEASSTTITVRRSMSSWLSSMSCSALATVSPRSPASSRIASSTALPVGASTSTSLLARCAAARSALQRVRFARAGGRLQRLHQIRRGRDVGDGARLVGGQVTEIRGAHIQPRAGVGRVDHVEDALLFGDHRVHGEQLMSFAVVRVARRADAHADHVDDLLDERARIPGASTGSSAPTSSTRSARVNAGLSMRATMRASRARSVSMRGAARRAAPRLRVRGAVELADRAHRRATPL